MRKVVVFIYFLTLATILLKGQNSDLFIPLNIQKAIDNGTRSLDGKPGKNYWQNKSEYKITAELLPDSSYLIGEEEITYYNNSPDSLRQILIRLYQDIYKIGAVRDWYFGKVGLNDGVKINYIIVNGDTLDISSGSRDIRRGSTNLTVYPKNKIAPKSSTKLKIGWEFEISERRPMRTGNYGDSNFYVAYWYPQIAVYDDIDGWDRVEYSGTVEFYNDFSDFDVKLKVPAGMVVWATGELQNGKELFREDIYNKYELAKVSDETVRIINQEDYKKGLVTADNEFNEWHFNAENVSDFTFAASKNFNWDGASVIVDSSTGRRSLTDVIYKDSTIHYDEGAQYARTTIEYLSHEIPGYPYPYTHATTFCNGSRGGGMESVMMANNGAPSGRASHIGLVFHEISHNYFPFMMGTNERKYAFMDEGWASFLPTEVVEMYEPESNYRSERVKSYAKAAGTEKDLPLVTPSYSVKTDGRLVFYNRPAVAYYELMELLGKDIFKKSMLEYINRWQGKHPIPQDFFYTINDVAGEDLSWFWRPWFFEFGYPDLSVTNVEFDGKTVRAVIKKFGNIPTRMLVVFVFDDGTIKSVSKSAREWKNGNNEIIVELATSKKVKNVFLENKYIPDSVEKNDFFTVK
jgi:hypothetical protein